MQHLGTWSAAVTYRHCEFGHLMVWQFEPLFALTYLAHVHEDEALSCAVLERMGWPRLDGH